MAKKNTPNIKVGKLLLPYGLGYLTNTNGTLRNYATAEKIGLKADWGISASKEHKSFEYDMSVSVGDGQKLDTSKGSNVFSARIGSSRNNNIITGISMFHSNIEDFNINRIGIDCTIYLPYINLAFEHSQGKNEDESVKTNINYSLAEINWLNSTETFNSYFQIRYSKALEKKTEKHVGFIFNPISRLSISMDYQWLKDLAPSKTKKIRLQLRYRFG